MAKGRNRILSYGSRTGILPRCPWRCQTTNVNYAVSTVVVHSRAAIDSAGNMSIWLRRTAKSPTLRCVRRSEKLTGSRCACHRRASIVGATFRSTGTRSRFSTRTAYASTTNACAGEASVPTGIAAIWCSPRRSAHRWGQQPAHPLQEGALAGVWAAEGSNDLDRGSQKDLRDPLPRSQALGR
jgi:hypothetical protein